MCKAAVDVISPFVMSMKKSAGLLKASIWYPVQTKDLYFLVLDEHTKYSVQGKNVQECNFIKMIVVFEL